MVNKRVVLTILYYAAIVAVIGYLIYCVIAIPKYRWVALILLVLLASFHFNIWRIFPCECRMIRSRAKELVGQRLDARPAEPFVV